jgi:hypothetical protein
MLWWWSDPSQGFLLRLAPQISQFLAKLLNCDSKVDCLSKTEAGQRSQSSSQEGGFTGAKFGAECGANHG